MHCVSERRPCAMNSWRVTSKTCIGYSPENTSAITPRNSSPSKSYWTDASTGNQIGKPVKQRICRPVRGVRPDALTGTAAFHARETNARRGRGRQKSTSGRSTTNIGVLSQWHIIKRVVSSYNGGDRSFRRSGSDPPPAFVALSVLRRSTLDSRRGVGASLRK